MQTRERGAGRMSEPSEKCRCTCFDRKFKTCFKCRGGCQKGGGGGGEKQGPSVAGVAAKKETTTSSNNKRMKICLRRAPSDFSQATTPQEKTPPPPYVPCLFTPATALHVGCHFLHKRTQFSMLRAARDEERERGDAQCVEWNMDRGEGEQGGGEGSA